MEALGWCRSVDVALSSFDDIINDGVPEGVDVIINAGDAGTSFVVERFGRMKRLLHVFVNSCITAAGFVGVGNQQPFIIKEDSSNLEIFWVLKEKWDIAFQQMKRHENAW